uniref:Uncharacterized protein n=1 Tax=Arundo donax TaxID=35708 RepID=A0A0A8YY08_ARUDO
MAHMDFVCHPIERKNRYFCIPSYSSKGFPFQTSKEVPIEKKILKNIYGAILRGIRQ